MLTRATPRHLVVFDLGHGEPPYCNSSLPGRSAKTHHAYSIPINALPAAERALVRYSCTYVVARVGRAVSDTALERLARSAMFMLDNGIAAKFAVLRGYGGCGHCRADVRAKVPSRSGWRVRPRQ